VSSRTASVLLSALDISGGASDGVSCKQSAGATTSVRLLNSNVRASVGVGVTVDTCGLTINASTISSNGGGGVSTTNCSVSIDASTISSNGGGINVASGTYTITNSFIVGNGPGGRGVNFGDSATGTFAFNTVAKNRVNSGVGGLNCGAGMAKTISASLVWANDLEAGTQFVGKCSLDGVVTGLDAFPNAGQKAIVFVDEGTLNYHLKPADPLNATCCIDQAKPPTSPNADHDVDLSKRPKGKGYDFGAHEVK
jgi:hypothetical protein